jgi:hypothetical protein
MDEEQEVLENELLLFIRWLAAEDQRIWLDKQAAVDRYMAERFDPNKKPCGCEAYDSDPHGWGCRLLP